MPNAKHFLYLHPAHILTPGISKHSSPFLHVNPVVRFRQRPKKPWNQKKSKLGLNFRRPSVWDRFMIPTILLVDIHFVGSSFGGMLSNE